MSVDLISRSQPVRTAGTSAKPSRAATFSGTNFLPHQEPTMMSGAAAISSGSETMRSLAFLRRAGGGETPLAPARARARERRGLAARPDQRAERADHVEDPRDVAVVERMHRDAAADQLG